MRNKEKLVFLDLVGNSNNLGAIIRSAAFFGIRHIIIPENEKQASIALRKEAWNLSHFTL